MFDGILFDLDGTLWDATATICDAWNRVLARHPEIVRGPVTILEVQGCMGLLLEDIGRKLFPMADGPTRARLTREQGEEMRQTLYERGGVLYPGVEDTLAELSRSARLFLVSNCGDGYLGGFYHAHGLARYFTSDLCAGRTGLPKSGNIAKVVRDYGLERPVYVGDTQLDYTSACDAGTPFLYAAYGFGTVDAAVPRAEAFPEIPAALAAMCPP